MPRRAIIIMLVVLIVGIIGGTVVLLLNRFQKSGDLATATVSPTPGGCETSDPTLDADNDGLSNGDEKLWGSDPCNPDTDGDTFQDGAEVKNGHNPTIAAPNDVLPAGFVPGRGVVNTNGVAATPVPSPTPDASVNLTQEYQKAVPESERSQEKEQEFIQSLNLTAAVPDIPATTIAIAPSGKANAGIVYMNSVLDRDLFFNGDRLDDVFSDLDTGDGTAAQLLANDWKAYSVRLQAMAVPSSAVKVQQMLIGYSQTMASLFTQMANTKDDEVRSIAAEQQYYELQSSYFPEIQDELQHVDAST